jgi:hypothetical protein
MTGWGWRIGASGVLCLLVSGCEPDRVRPPPAILRWMECIECADGELGAVGTMGAAALPLLLDLFEDGPPADRRRRVRQRLDSLHTALRGYTAAHPGTPLPSRAGYVNAYLRHYDDLYRSRSITALATIGGPQAAQVLQAATSDSFSPGVTAALRFALDSICGVRPDPTSCR